MKMKECPICKANEERLYKVFQEKWNYGKEFGKDGARYKELDKAHEDALKNWREHGLVGHSKEMAEDDFDIDKDL